MNCKGRFRKPPSRNIDWFQSFVSGTGLIQLILRWEGLVSGSFGSFRLVSASFGLFRVVQLFSNYPTVRPLDRLAYHVTVTDVDLHVH